MEWLPRELLVGIVDLLPLRDAASGATLTCRALGDAACGAVQREREARDALRSGYAPALGLDVAAAEAACGAAHLRPYAELLRRARAPPIAVPSTMHRVMQRHASWTQDIITSETIDNSIDNYILHDADVDDDDADHPLCKVEPLPWLRAGTLVRTEGPLVLCFAGVPSVATVGLYHCKRPHPLLSSATSIAVRWRLLRVGPAPCGCRKGVCEWTLRAAGAVRLETEGAPSEGRDVVDRVCAHLAAHGLSVVLWKLVHTNSAAVSAPVAADCGAA